MKAVRIFIVFLWIGTISSCSPEADKILIFSKTEGSRQGSIEAGVVAMKRLGEEKGFLVEATEDVSYFTEEVLRNYAAVVFLNTTGDILNGPQRADFERYIQAGGGFVGVHAATDTEYDWPWYNKLVGADFDGGRAFFTEMDHSDDSFEDPIFMEHLWGGLRYVVGKDKLDYGKARTERIPEENRYVRQVLDQNLDEPM
ncbi:MAG TPA: ThuA domain-containing protein, partial [Arenibacter sp.]|nr:ThuA domain-containing protein [Arenibacter sp.]